MEELRRENERLKQENQELRELVKQITEKLVVAEQKIQQLTEQLGQNSRNSHWSSSRDKSRKKKRSKSLRKKSTRKAGGQKGHRGHTLEFRDKPDQIVSHRPQACQHCQTPFAAEQEAIGYEKRQVLDLPPLAIMATEHRAETLLCKCCGQENGAGFPSDVTNPVQYGPGIKQLAIYLKNVQFIPYDRSQQFFADLFSLKLSPGSLQNFNKKAARRLQPVTKQIITALKHSAVVHFDESGLYIGGRRHWLHSAGTPTLTAYYPHQRRGKQATDAMGILPVFRGTAVHDHWSTYWHYKLCRHSLCNVHHLRDLTGIVENFKQPWAERFKTFLLAANQVVDQAKLAGLTALPKPKVAQVERLYAQLVTAALQANPPPPGGWPTGKRGRSKKTKARNLAERFEKHQSAVLAFVYDFKVPFDNNLAERDIRMIKVQQKISGCFRSWHGAEDFSTIRSYISTIRKQGLSVWQALGSVFSGNILIPDLTPV